MWKGLILALLFAIAVTLTWFIATIETVYVLLLRILENRDEFVWYIMHRGDEEKLVPTDVENIRKILFKDRN